MKYREKIGIKEHPLTLKTPPLSSDYTMHVDEKDGRDILVCNVKTTVFHSVDVKRHNFLRAKRLCVGKRVVRYRKLPIFKNSVVGIIVGGSRHHS